MIMKTEFSHRVSEMGIEVTRISVARQNRKLSAAMGGRSRQSALAGIKEADGGTTNSSLWLFIRSRRRKQTLIPPARSH